MSEPANFKEKARRFLFNTELRNFGIVFYMYLETLHIYVDNVDGAIAHIIEIIRASEDEKTAYVMVCHYLDELEENPYAGQ